MKKALLGIFLLLLASPISAGEITVETGYGYYQDTDNHIVSKAQLPKGKHQLRDGLTYVEVVSKAELDAVKIYQPPKTEQEINEGKIQKEIKDTIRKQAIDSLKAKGELPQDYKDK